MTDTLWEFLRGTVAFVAIAVLFGVLDLLATLVERLRRPRS